MQNSEETATFVFQQVGQPYDSSLPHQSLLLHSQVILGALFIQGYRSLFTDQKNMVLTFVRRNHKQSQYLFLTFTNQPPSTRQDLLPTVQPAIEFVRKVKKITKQTAFPYKVILAFLQQHETLELEGPEYQAALRGEHVKGEKGSVQPTVDVFPDKEEEVECLDVMSSGELEKIRIFVWAYLDTFGQKYKDNLYHEFQKGKEKHMDVQRVIRTINWIIYCQTVDRPYNQLESSNWTCFEVRRDMCKSDRKEIVLTGHGCILYIPLLFICEKIENYKIEYHRELFEVMQETKKYYSEGEIKAYLITDQPHPTRLLYLTQHASLHKYPEKMIR